MLVLPCCHVNLINCRKCAAPCRGGLKVLINIKTKSDKGPTNSNEINLREEPRCAQCRSHTCQSERVGQAGSHHGSSCERGAEYCDWQPHHDYRIGAGEKLFPQEEKEERCVDDQHKRLQVHS